jgi:hypothetical protein
VRNFMIAAVAALAFASVANAAGAPGTYSLNAAGKCMGPAPKTTLATASKCKAPAPAPMAAATTHTAAASTGAKHCVKGKACGNTCIKATDVCHK